MEWYILIFSLIQSPSVAIYYFTDGDWPLAFKLQLSYIIVLLIAVFILYVKWRVDGGSGSGGGRGSNNIGAVVGVALLFIFIVPLVIFPSIIAAFSYYNTPIGEPGFLKPFIKWGLISSTLLVLFVYIYYLFKRYLGSKK